MTPKLKLVGDGYYYYRAIHVQNITPQTNSSTSVH